ncbi:MAG: hypothetical protein AAF447_18215 [Myxococcota bacterium]
MGEGTEVLIERLFAAEVALRVKPDTHTRILRGLGRTGSPHVLPALLPYLTRRGWLHSQRRPTAEVLEGLAQVALEAARAIVDPLPRRDLVRVDQRVRASWEKSGWVPHGWRRMGPDEVGDLPGDDALLLGLVAGHPSGYVRAEAVERLPDAGDEALPWLLLRCVDWVGPVRTRALWHTRQLLERAGPDALLDVLPLARRLRNFARRDVQPLADELDARAGALPDEPLTAALRPIAGRSPRAAERRRVLAEVLIAQGQLSPDQRKLLLASGDLQLRRRVLRALPRAPEYLGEFERGLGDASGQIRRLCLEALVATQGPSSSAPALRRYLTDVVRSVREVARFHLREADAGFDARSYYLAELARRPFSRGVVAGVGDVGRPGDWEALVPALDGPPRAAREALTSLRHLDRRATREVRLMMVDDARPTVSRAAARGLLEEVGAVGAGVLSTLLGSSQAHSRAHGAWLLSRTPGPEALEALLLNGGETNATAVEAALIEKIRREMHPDTPMSSNAVTRLGTALEAASWLGPRARFAVEVLLTRARRPTDFRDPYGLLADALETMALLLAAHDHDFTLARRLRQDAESTRGHELHGAERYVALRTEQSFVELPQLAEAHFYEAARSAGAWARRLLRGGGRTR